MQTRLYPVILACALGAYVSPARAALILYDPFTQAVGNITGTASPTSGIWPGAGTWNGGGAIAAGSLTYGTLLTTGNQANYDANANANRTIGGTPLGGANTDLWISFLITGNQINTGISLFNGGAEQNFMGHGGGSGQTLGLQNPNIVSTVLQNTGTHMYVLRMQTGAVGNITSTLYIDPPVSSLGTGTAPAPGSLFTNSAAPETFRVPYLFDTVRLGNFVGGGNVRFDEFRLGTTWADVSPIVAVIPEPSIAALLALGAGGLTLGRRRRSALAAQAA